MPELDPSRLEDCRFQVRRALYARLGVAMDVDSIRHQLDRWACDFPNAEIIAALTFLSIMEPAQAAKASGEMAGPARWRITTAGMAAYEANA